MLLGIPSPITHIIPTNGSMFNVSCPLHKLALLTYFFVLVVVTGHLWQSRKCFLKRLLALEGCKRNVIYEDIRTKNTLKFHKEPKTKLSRTLGNYLLFNVFHLVCFLEFSDYFVSLQSNSRTNYYII